MNVSQNAQGTHRREIHHSVTALCLHVDAIRRRDDLWMKGRAIRKQTFVCVSLKLLDIQGIVGASHFGAM
jgi:hypothetical protein